MERGNSSPSLHILRTPPIPCPEASIYQRFTPNLADHSASLTEATRKAAPDVVEWTNSRKDDFVYLCSALAGKYWLHDPSRMTVKFCNSSFSNKALYVILCPRRFIFSNGSHSGLRNLPQLACPNSPVCLIPTHTFVALPLRPCALSLASTCRMCLRWSSRESLRQEYHLCIH